MEAAILKIATLGGKVSYQQGDAMLGVFEVTGTYEDFHIGLYIRMLMQDPLLAC